MLNNFDTYFLNIIPSYSGLWAKLVTITADPKLHLLIWGLVTLYLYSRDKMEVIKSNSFYFLSQTICIMFICGIMKITAGRARPYLLESDISGFFFFSVHHAYLSLPSSHMAVAIGIAHIFRRYYSATIFIYTWPLLIALSRLSLKAHFATDVLLGTFIGFCVSHYLSRVYEYFIINSSKVY